MAAKLEQLITRGWFEKSPWLWLLLPLSALFYLLYWLRKQAFKLGLKPVVSSDVPVLVVGNIVVGGAGKSPLVAYLVRELQALGYKVGIVSRGYGAQQKIDKPILLDGTSAVAQVGDEPLMLFRQLGCPVAVCPQRSKAVALLAVQGCDLVIADDGLQHYAMARDIEICTFDSQRLWGNGLLLPAGPLREPLARMQRCDYLVFNGGIDDQVNAHLAQQADKAFAMALKPSVLRSLSDNSAMPADELASLQAGPSLFACAGIGNPERFYKTLQTQGFSFEPHSFPDHHAFNLADFAAAKGRCIVMTEKDAVKCRDLRLDNAWYLPVAAELSNQRGQSLARDIVAKLKATGRLAKAK